MGVYATTADLEAYMAGPPRSPVEADLPDDDNALEALIANAERAVDRAIGGPKLPTGLALNPAALTIAQRAALSRATCAAAEHLLATADEQVGDSEYLFGGGQLLWRGRRPPGPKVDEELAGYGLIRRAGVAPTPPKTSAVE